MKTVLPHLLLVLFAPPLMAQAPAVPTVPASRADTVQAPISPKRAFFLSLLFPGAAQSRLGRHKVAAGILGVEMASVVMIRESGFDVREARQQRGDSLVVSYVDDNGAKLPLPVRERRRFGDEEVSSRRSHVEDWVALLIANHLFAAAEGFVAASLWDVDARVSVAREGGRNFLVGSFRW